MKSPKEKAKELVDKFLNLKSLFSYKDSEGFYCTLDGKLANSTAKKYVLIAVDEIINSTDWSKAMLYWQQVKQEIEKL